MKNLELKLSIYKRKNFKVLSLVMFMFLTMIITSSCTKSDAESTENKPLSIAPPLSFEKKFLVYDASGVNSVTLRISADDEALLANHTPEGYELIINPEILNETPKDASPIVEEGLFDFTSDIEAKAAAVHIDIMNTNFKGKVNHYSLVSHNSSNIEEEEDEESRLFCQWFPGNGNYYTVSNTQAIQVTTTFNRTKITCNNIEYGICTFNSFTPFSYYALKNPGDTRTTNASGTGGITIIYQQHRNQIPTYTWTF